MSTESQRQQWRELADAATPGEWRKIYSVVTANEGVTHIAHAPAVPNGEADAAFIAAARAAVPQLLADVDALTGERDDYRSRYRVMEREVELIRGQLIAMQQERDALAAELASYKRQAAYISSVIDSEGKYVP